MDWVRLLEYSTKLNGAALGGKYCYSDRPPSLSTVYPPLKSSKEG